MNEGDRIARLEERVSRLEEALSRAAGQWGSGAAGQSRVQAEQVVTTTAHPGGSAAGGTAPRPRGPAAPPNTVPPPRRAAALLSSEQWIGQRVLLAVGVVALILAAGYLLRLSFDRGWISPIMRCIGGA